MSWCCCCKPEDEAIRLWKDNTKDVIKLVKNIQNLGKKCILNRQVNREDSIDVKQIIKCFRELDKGIHSIKFEAVQFLAPNFELLNQRNCQINHYKENAEKRFKILNSEIKKLKQRYAESNVDEKDNHEPCSSQTNCNKFQEREELFQNAPEAQLFAREVFLKQDKLLGDLKILLEKYHENVIVLKDEIDRIQKEVVRDKLEDNAENEQNHSEYDSDEEIQVNKSEYAVQYSIKNRKRYSQEYIDDYGSQVHSSNETVTFFNREFVEQGWPLFRDCIGCVWTNYCVSSEQQGYTETYNRSSNRSRIAQREVEEEYDPNKVKSRSGSTKGRRLKPKNVMEEDISRQSNTRNVIAKKNKKSGKSRSPAKPKQPKTDKKDRKVKKKKNKEQKKTSGGAKKSKNVNKTKNGN